TTSDIAFAGGFEGNVGSGFGIFVADPRGAISKVIDDRTEVPNHPGVAFSGFPFNGVYLADDRTIIFQGRYNLDGLDFHGFYRKSGRGLAVIFDQVDGLVVNGEHISLIDEDEERVLSMYLAPRFADVVDGAPRVAFLQEPARRESRYGIFAAVLPPATAI